MPSIEHNHGTAKYRVRVSRLGPVRWLTHLSQIETLRRAVERANLPAVLDRRRKRPRPKLSFGPAISVGYESLAEYFDMELAAAQPPARIMETLQASLEEGFVVRQVRRIPVFFPSLEASVNVVRYEIRGPFPLDAQERLNRFLTRERIVIEKLKQGGAKVEHVDARTLIVQMSILAPERLGLTLRFGPKRTVKPEALLREWLGLPSPQPSVRMASETLEESRLEPLQGFEILRKDLLSETIRGELLTP